MNHTVWIFEGSHGRADVLAQLVSQYAAAMQDLGGGVDSADPLERLAAEMETPTADVPLEPRFERLFPPALGDDQQAREFRRAAMTQQAADRLGAAQTVLDGLTRADGGDVEVSAADIDAWVKTLSGLRASWHVELTGSVERLAEPSPQDILDNQAVAAVCDWMGYLVEEALASRSAMGEAS